MALARKAGWHRVLAHFGLKLTDFEKEKWVTIPLEQAVKGLERQRLAAKRKKAR
jgi:hypothetical protein